jgi:hypothetical protein
VLRVRTECDKLKVTFRMVLFPFVQLDSEANQPANNLVLFRAKIQNSLRTRTIAMTSRSFQEILSLLLELNVDSVEEEVGNRLWKGEGNEGDTELFQSLATNLRKGILRDIVAHFYTLKDEARLSFWSFLCERRFVYRNLILFLNELIRTDDDEKQRPERAFTCGVIYLNLLSLSPLCFHPLVLRSTVNLLRTWISSFSSVPLKRKHKKNQKNKTKDKQEEEDNEGNAENLLVLL